MIFYQFSANNWQVRNYILDMQVSKIHFSIFILMCDFYIVCELISHECNILQSIFLYFCNM